MSVIKLSLKPGSVEADTLDGQSRICNWLYNKLRDSVQVWYQQFIETKDPELAKKIYTELKNKGYVKTERKDGNEYICLTEKGKMSCKNKLEETRKLKRYFMSLPLLQVKYNEEEVPAVMVVKGSQPLSHSYTERLVEQIINRISDW